MRLTNNVLLVLSLCRLSFVVSLSVQTAPSIGGTNDGLPPDPGKAGKQTLMGIDSDGDGLRDDVQRYIYLTYPDQPDVQRALKK